MCRFKQSNLFFPTHDPLNIQVIKMVNNPYDNVRKGWKITALILIIVLVLSWTLFLYTVTTGINMVQNEEKCGNYCGYQGLLISYQYDYELGICQCYDASGEVIAYKEYG